MTDLYEILERWKFTERALRKPLEAFLGKSVKPPILHNLGVLNLIGPDIVPSDAILTFKMAEKQDGRHQADVK